MTSPISAKLLPALRMLLRWLISKRPRTWRETSVALVPISGLLNVRGQAAAGAISTSPGAISSSAKFELGTQRGELFGSPLLFGVEWEGFFAHTIAKAQKAPAEKAPENA